MERIMNDKNYWDHNVEGDAVAGISQRVLDGLGMPVEWALSIVVPIFKEKVIS